MAQSHGDQRRHEQKSSSEAMKEEDVAHLSCFRATFKVDTQGWENQKIDHSGSAIKNKKA